MNFQEYNEQHPEVYKGFIKLALQTKAKGFKHYSARTIVHVLRFHSDVSENGTEYKINDHVTPMFARQAMQDYPELDGFFELRRSKFDNRIND